MSSRGQAIYAKYRAWNTVVGAPALADVANHELKWVKDGVPATPINAPSEVSGGSGDYQVLLTSAETTCNDGQIVGTSSTSGVRIFGLVYTFEDALAANITAIHAKLPSKAKLAGTDNTSGAIEMSAATGAFPGTVAGLVDKAGMILAPTGLDSIAVTPPSGVATTFPQMLVQLFRRFFGKATQTSSQLKTLADDGMTVVTTQALTDDGTTQTQGKAE